jgi:hypothetical protein
MTSRGTHGERLDEQLATAELHRARRPALERIEPDPDELRVELRRAEAAREASVVADEQLGRRRRPFAGLMRTEIGRWRVGRQRRDNGRAVGRARFTRRGLARREHRRRRDRWLDEHVDRAATREANVPGLLVADAVADDAGTAARSGTLDLLRGCSLHAAAAHGTGDPAVGRVEEDRALGSRRGAERADHDGPSGVGTICSPGLERVDELLHVAPLRDLSGPTPCAGIRC